MSDTKQNSSFYNDKGTSYGTLPLTVATTPSNTNSSFYPGNKDYSATPTFTWAWYLPLP